MRTSLENYLLTMWNDGWANTSHGEVDSPTGAFALIVIEPGELAEVRAAFDDDDAVTAYGLPSDDELTGYFVVVQSSLGFILVSDHETCVKATVHYSRLVTVADEWSASTDEDDEIADLLHGNPWDAK